MRKITVYLLCAVLLLLNAGVVLADQAISFSSILPVYAGGTAYIGGRAASSSSGDVTLRIYKPGEDTVWIEEKLQIQPDGSFSYPLKTLPDVEDDYKVTVESSFGSDSTTISIKKRTPEPTAPAASNETGEIQVLLNGEAVTFDVPPEIRNDRVLVPMRKIFEKIGAQVFWDEATSTVTATRGTDSVSLTIGAQSATINGAEQALDQPAVIQDGRTLVPIRFVSEALHMQVKWVAESRTVVITEA